MIVKKIVIITEDEAEEKLLRSILADQEPETTPADKSLEWQSKVKSKYNFHEEDKKLWKWTKLQEVSNLVLGEEADKSIKLKVKAALENLKIKTKRIHNSALWLMPPLVTDELPIVPVEFDKIPHKQSLADIMKNYKKREV